MSFKIRPLQDRVVLRPEKEQEKKSEGGILLPGVAEDAKATQNCEVLEIGLGKITKEGRQEMEVKKGDIVLIGTYSGSTVRINGEKLMIAHESEILAVLEQEH